ncbi:DUF6049 family protein, partial [Pseudactinotalea sp.]|uniref:DUF6049 family protein n=1 Tax=Pseudactinotalea sp. TaxID=1926260 RepID=UPI003B3B1092
AMLAAVLGLGLALLPHTPARADDGDLVVELMGVTPAVVTTGDDLVITGRIRNTTNEELPAPAVRLMLQLHVPSSTEALASWLDGSSDLNVSALTGWNTEEDADPIAAGAEVPFRIEIPLGSDGTFSQLSAWGPRGIEIQARSEEATGSARTTMLWYPTDPPVRTPSELTLLVPLTPTTQEWQQAAEQGVPVGQIAAPRLLEVLDAVGPDASLALDPALLETVPPGAAAANEAEAEGTGTPDESPSTEEATPPEDESSAVATLIERLTASERRGDVIALGYADADVSSLVTAGGEDLWSDGVTRSEELLADVGLTIEDVAWPPGELSADGLAALIDTGSEAVVLGAGDVGIAASTHATATAGSDSLDALLSDDELGQALATSTLSGIPGRQALLALSAVLTRALPQEPSGFLVTLPRDIGTGDLGQLADQVQALADAPWFEFATLRSQLGRTGAGTTLEVPQQVATPDAVDATAVESLLAGREVVATYTEAAGSTIQEIYTPGLLTPLSASLVQEPTLREELLTAATDATTDLSSMIRVEAGSDLLLISGDASLPVTVSNQLPVEARVVVELVPEGSRLQAREVAEEVLGPEQTSTVRIPITALANGDVQVDVHVRPNVDGADLAEPASFAVRVRAEWENIGTGIVAGLLAVAFIIGLIRTIRRGGRRAAAQ